MANESQGKIEEVLQDLGRKIDHLIADTKDATGGIRVEVEKKIADLKAQRDKLEEEIKTYKEQEKWKDAKSHFSSALQELKKGIETAFSKKS